MSISAVLIYRVTNMKDYTHKKTTKTLNENLITTTRLKSIDQHQHQHHFCRPSVWYLLTDHATKNYFHMYTIFNNGLKILQDSGCPLCYK